MVILTASLSPPICVNNDEVDGEVNDRVVKF